MKNRRNKQLRFELHPYKIAFVLTAGLVFTIFKNDFNIFQEYAEIISMMKTNEPKANAIFVDARENNKTPTYLIKMERDQSATVEELFKKYDANIDKMIKYVKQPFLLPMVRDILIYLIDLLKLRNNNSWSNM